MDDQDIHASQDSAPVDHNKHSAKGPLHSGQESRQRPQMSFPRSPRVAVAYGPDARRMTKRRCHGRE